MTSLASVRHEEKVEMEWNGQKRSFSGIAKKE